MNINNSKTVGVIVMCSVLGLYILKKRKNRQIWSKNWYKRRNTGRGVLHMLNKELQHEDPNAYQNFLRFNKKQVDELLMMVEPLIRRQDTNMRQCISAQSRLEITLRYLATGDSYRSLMYASRIHESTISLIVPEVCKAIIQVLKDKYLKTPNSTEMWENIATDFYNLWQFPNCIGALDGRHIKFRPPRSAGSMYYNYKGDHSVVLMALSDANYRFTYVNVGINGRISDGGVFRECNLSKAIFDNSLNLPAAQELPERRIKVPYIIVADDAFPLSTRLLKPYSLRHLSHSNRIFNYRLSRARRVVENAFGILANRFRVLLNPIPLGPNKVEIITLACVALHNFLSTENLTNYADTTMAATTNNQQLERIIAQGPNRPTNSALQIRAEFEDYFNNEGAVDWQNSAIERHNM